jgi:hypothetical protein
LKEEYTIEDIDKAFRTGVNVGVEGKKKFQTFTFDDLEKAYASGFKDGLIAKNNWEEIRKYFTDKIKKK